jgi:2-polyprenyl-6-methoxyphenol hydroxylase-like FAD-dependent oxidoreductase
MSPLSPTRTDVLIVGAGPSGLALAIALRQLGVDALQVDRLAEGENTSRAAVVHARTLDVLEPLGVVPALLDAGLKVHHFHVREGDRSLMHIDFSGLPSAHPYTLMCPQNLTEALLMRRLAALGGAVERPARLVRLRPREDGSGVEAEMESDAGSRRVEARWVVGCDGAHSAVRTEAGIAFEGGRYEDSFVLADVRMDWPLSRDEVSLFFSAPGLMVVAPLPDQRFRIVATQHHAPEPPGLSDVQALLDERGPSASTGGGAGRVGELLWSSRFLLQHKVAAEVLRGRVLLCGDAAHVHSPAGGQGMNTGIQDAVSLAEPLARALRDDADRAGLAAWAARRQQVAREVVALTDRMTRAATASSPMARSVRNALLTVAGHFPFIEQRIARRLAELDN